MGFPIRKSSDQRVFAPPRRLSQRITSFIACACQGIHQLPLRHLIVLIANAHHDFSQRHRHKKTSFSRSVRGQRLGKPIICGRLSVSPRQTIIITAQTLSTRHGSLIFQAHTPTTESEQIFSLQCQTEQAAAPRSEPQILDRMIF